MERTLIGYRIRAKSGDGFVYLSSCRDRPAFPAFFWSKRLANDFLIPDGDYGAYISRLLRRRGANPSCRHERRSDRGLRSEDRRGIPAEKSPEGVIP